MPVTASSQDELQQMVKDCRARQARMDEWERELIRSLEERIAAGAALSQRQITQLNLVWDRVTEKG